MIFYNYNDEKSIVEKNETRRFCNRKRRKWRMFSWM